MSKKPQAWAVLALSALTLFSTNPAFGAPHQSMQAHPDQAVALKARGVDPALWERARSLPFGSQEMAQAGHELVSALRGELDRAHGDQPTGWFVYLQDAPSAKVYGKAIADAEVQGVAAKSAHQSAANAARAQAQALVAKQNALLPQVQKHSERILFRAHKALNGFAVRATGAQAAELRKLPGVARVELLDVDRPMTSTSVPYILDAANANGTLWTAGQTGTGIRIGIIDTGIDYIHKDFGGSGLQADYDANDTTTAGDGSFPTAKVVGGHDFAGDDYDANSTVPSINTPVPDDDPMDCNGHGSHVSGIAAGIGVDSLGNTYSGPYDQTTPFTTMQIGPGVAPNAQLYAIRVFGCNGSTNLTEQGIEWAMDPNGDDDFTDHLDVINMSLGSSFGGSYSSSALAADAAVDAGVIVVTSAGNSGDTYYVAGSPGNAKKVISTASNLDSIALRINAPAGIAGDYLAANAVFGPQEFNLTGDVVEGLDPSDGAGALTTDACSPLTNAAQVAGKIALVDRGTCNFSVKVYNAQLAGAVGVLVANSAAGVFGGLGSGTNANLVTIPSQMITNPLGTTLHTTLTTDTVNVTMSNNAFAFPGANDSISSFSSRGPARGDGVVRLKPDVTAPGSSITSAGALNGACSLCVPGDPILTISGTSMASPHVAGAMALLRQRYPAYTVEQLKSLVMTHSLKDTFSQKADGTLSTTRFDPAREGAGRIDLDIDKYDPAGTKPLILATNPAVGEEGVISVSLGHNEVVTTATAGGDITLRKGGGTPANYNIAYDPVTAPPGVTITVSPTTLSLPGNAPKNVHVTLQADATLMHHDHAPTVTTTQLNAAGTFSRNWLNEASGFVTVTPVGAGDAIRIPVYASLRSASTMAPTSNTASFGSNMTGTANIPLTGTPVQEMMPSPSTAPQDTWATTLELQEINPDDPSTTGVENDADLHYVGVGSNYPASGSLSSTGGGFLTFGVATYGDWQTPSEVEFDVYVDTDHDGHADYIVFNWNLGAASGGSPDDTHRTVVANLHTNGLASSGIHLNGIVSLFGLATDTVFNNNVMALVLGPQLLGITSPANARFDYFVAAFGSAASPDVSDVHSFDATAPAIDSSVPGNVGGLNLNTAEAGDSIDFDFDATQAAADQALGALVLFHNNTEGTRASVISLDSTLTDVTVHKFVTATEPVDVGDTVTYDIRVDVNGPGPASNVEMTDTVPAELTITNVSNADTTCGVAGQAITCDWASIAAHGQEIVTVTTTVNALTANTIVNTANVTTTSTEVNTNNNSSQATVNTAYGTKADITVDKTSNATEPVDVGSTFDYTVTVANSGAHAADNVQLTDTVPSDLTIGTVTNPDTTCTVVAQLVTCTWTSIASSANEVVTIPVTVSTVTAATIDNTASATTDTAELSTDNNSDSVSVATTFGTTIDLVVTKTSNAVEPVDIGDTFDYTITVDNSTGTVAAGTVQVVDTVPDGLTIGTLPAQCGAVGQTVTCNYALIAAGGQQQIVIPVTVAVNNVSFFVNTATMTTATAQSDTSNDSATVSVRTVLDLPFSNGFETGDTPWSFFQP